MFVLNAFLKVVVASPRAESFIQGQMQRLYVFACISWTVGVIKKIVGIEVVDLEIVHKKFSYTFFLKWTDQEISRFWQVLNFEDDPNCA